MEKIMEEEIKDYKEVSITAHCSISYIESIICRLKFTNLGLFFKLFGNSEEDKKIKKLIKIVKEKLKTSLDSDDDKEQKMFYLKQKFSLFEDKFFYDNYFELDKKYGTYDSHKDDLQVLQAGRWLIYLSFFIMGIITYYGHILNNLTEEQMFIPLLFNLIIIGYASFISNSPMRERRKRKFFEYLRVFLNTEVLPDSELFDKCGNGEKDDSSRRD